MMVMMVVVSVVVVVVDNDLPKEIIRGIEV